MTIATETLMAYVDGELDAADVRRVERAIAQDAALASYVEEQKALRLQLERAFAPIIAAPLPEQLERTIMAAPLPRPARRRVFVFPFLRLHSAWIPAGAVAVGVVFGIFAMSALNSGAVIGHRNGELIAQGALANALSNDLASEQVAAAQNRIGVSFRDKDGDYCRSFTSNGGSALAGIACFRRDQWRIATVATSEPGDATKFQPAAAAMPDAVRAALNGMIAAAPLDANGERDARDRGWRAH